MSGECSELKRRIVLIQLLTKIKLSKDESHDKNVPNSGISYHGFPKDPEIKGKWIEMEDKIGFLPLTSTICLDHVVQQDIIL
ncbi:hypothetical protein SFRURICE_005719 [Spodoptera frugiperda]|nr:hypothetical protein SFRURICE_005719 [Spodoptera frugiperda]